MAASHSSQAIGQVNASGVTVTDSNSTPILQLVTWFLLAAASLMLFFRLLTKYFLKAQRVPGSEDIFIFASYVSEMAQKAASH